MPYFEKRYHKPGTPPGTLVTHKETVEFPLTTRLIDYNGSDYQENELVTANDCRPFLTSANVTWIHLQGDAPPETLLEIGDLFGLHTLAMEDVLNSGQRPKIEEYDEHLFIIMTLPVSWEDGTETEQISLFASENLLITFHGGATDPFEPIRNRLRKNGGRLRRQGVDHLLHSILDLVIDLGFPLLESFGERIEDLEEVLLESPSKATLSDIHEIKRELIFMRRVLWPQREIVNYLLRTDKALITDGVRIYLRDCYDHTVQLIDLIENYRDMTASMLDVYLSSVSHRLNETMRVLTVIATIFIPLTFIVGIYGMNFESNSPWAMPELHWYYGYPMIWGIMIAVAAGMIMYFWRKDWF